MTKNVIDPWQDHHAVEGDNYELIYLSGEQIEFSKFVFNHVLESKTGGVTVLSSGRKDIPPYAPGKVAAAEIKVTDGGRLGQHIPTYVSLPNDQWLELAEVRQTDVGGLEEFFRTQKEEIAEEISAGADVAEGTADRVGELAGEAGEIAGRAGRFGAIAIPVVIAGLVAFKILDAIG